VSRVPAGQTTPVTGGIRAAGGESAVSGSLADYATIRFLVKNAGITRVRFLLRMKKALADFVLETNLNGIYRLCRGVIPSPVRARGGRMVDITSVVVRAGNRGAGYISGATLKVNGGVYM